MADLLSTDEIVRLLNKFSREINYGSGNRSGNPRRVVLNNIAELIGIAHYTLREYMLRRYPVPEHVQHALTPILRDIEAGRLRFRRTGKAVHKDGITRPVTQDWEIEYRKPPARLPPPQSRVIRADDYNEWATCGSCGHPRFSPFRSDRTYYACDSCVSEADRRMLGARYG